MALFVNTNTSSINSQRNLNKSTKALDGSYKKLASGLRINSAKDDAAGLQIADRMTSQINGLVQGNRNANDGISMCQTTEGALEEVTNMLQRIRTLSIQSANGTNSTAERAAIEDEVTALKEEIVRIGHDTTFGLAKNVLGDTISAEVTKFQVGSNTNQTISLQMKSLTKSLVVSANGSVSEISVATASQAQNAIAAVDEMIKNVDSYRSTLGAVQNRLESTISNQENVIENVSDARSRIRDVDYASETAQMTQQSILQQASTTILSQANSKTQIAMNLIG